jgi:Mg-chelatase subunit ChlD
VDLTALFDRTSYQLGEDPLAYLLAKVRVSAGVESADIRSASDGPEVDVALVLDVSGSMDKPNRYPLLCEAVRRLVVGLDPQDWISITLFTDRSETVFPFMPVEEAASDPEQVIRAMKESGLLFGPRTNLAPGLRLALEGFRSRAASGGRVRRTYVLTDGELHDTPECEAVLNGFRPLSIELHVYGFGDGFHATDLKRLVSDQIGGTVKPIVNEKDITRTFAHVAEVNRRLAGTDAKLEVSFSPEVVCGDAWVFQPHGRYLGVIRDRRVEHVIGGIEFGRWYSLLLEVRLPPGSESVGVAKVSWIAGDERVSRQTEMIAVRKQGAATSVPEVRRALDILQILRAGDDSAAQLASFKARRELAVLEHRDPQLIAALDKMIASLINPSAEAEFEEGKPVEPHGRPGERVDPFALDRWNSFIQTKTAHASLTEEERLILDSDESTVQAVLRTAEPDPTERKTFPEVLFMEGLIPKSGDSECSVG